MRPCVEGGALKKGKVPHCMAGLPPLPDGGTEAHRRLLFLSAGAGLHCRYRQEFDPGGELT
jgi:hypothetical protein